MTSLPGYKEVLLKRITTVFFQIPWEGGGPPRPWESRGPPRLPSNMNRSPAARATGQPLDFHGATKEKRGFTEKEKWYIIIYYYGVL